MLWFTSDTHFGHAKVLEFAHRPWVTASQMAGGLVAKINERVLPEDDLYVLGDFSFRITALEAAGIRKKINCRHVHLVPGNHDKDWTRPELAGNFIVEPPICVIKLARSGVTYEQGDAARCAAAAGSGDVPERRACAHDGGSLAKDERLDGRKLVLSHYPIADWQAMSSGSWHLHGHIHAPRVYNELNRAQSLCRYDVGVDANDYAPVNLTQLADWFDGVEPRRRVNWLDWVNQTGDAEVEERLEQLRAQMGDTAS